MDRNVKTGGHFRPCNVGSVEAHNERRPEYLESVKKAGLKLYFFEELSKDNESFVNLDERYRGKTVAQIFDEMKHLYMEKFGQKPCLEEKTITNKKTGKTRKVSGWSPIREMAVPIKKNTTIKDFDYLKKWLERHGLSVLRIDIHKDEGHLNEDTGEREMNYHAHVVVDFLNKETGKTIKLNSEKMSEMQTIIAISLDMERGEPKADTGLPYLTHQQLRLLHRLEDELKKNVKKTEEELTSKNHELSAKKDELNAVSLELKNAKHEFDLVCQALKQAETRVKGLTSMVNNLEDQIRRLKKQKTELVDKVRAGEVSLDQMKSQERKLQQEIHLLEEKLADKSGKLTVAEAQLQKCMSQFEQVLANSKILAANATKEYEKIKAHAAAAEQHIKNEDKSGVVERKDKQLSARDSVILSLWPQVPSALKAIVERTSNSSAKQFTSRQAIDVENALSASSLSRQDAAQSLMSLAQREFDDSRTWSGWIQSTAKEVMEIANKVHPLSPFLLQLSTGGQGGDASHITDLTDWDGKKKKGLQ